MAVPKRRTSRSLEKPLRRRGVDLQPISREPTFTFARDLKPDLDTEEGRGEATFLKRRYMPQGDYATPGEAADVALHHINQLSADTRQEYGGDIYLLPSGRYAPTAPVTSKDPEHVEVPDVFPSDAPKGSTRVGDYHTHGGNRNAPPGPKDTSRHFSGGDLNEADRRQNTLAAARNYYAYMANPEGEIRQYDPGMIPAEQRQAYRRDTRALGIAPPHAITTRGQIPMTPPRVSAPERAMAQATTQAAPPIARSLMSLPRLPEGVTSEQAQTEDFLAKQEEQAKVRKRISALNAMRGPKPAP